MIFVYDRTIEDVMRAIELIGKVDSLGFAALTVEEQTEWMAGLRGCYNATDLERVDVDCIILAANLSANGYAPVISPFSGWTMSMIPTAADMERIRTNIASIRNAIAVPSTVPSVPWSLDNMDFNKANILESILYAVSRALARVTGSMQRTNTLYAGGGILI